MAMALPTGADWRRDDAARFELVHLLRGRTQRTRHHEDEPEPGPDGTSGAVAPATTPSSYSNSAQTAGPPPAMLSLARDFSPAGLSDDCWLVARRYPMDAVKKGEEFKEWTQQITGEATLMRQLRHPHLLPCQTSYVSGTEIVLITPLMNYGSVRDLLDSHFPEGLPEPSIAGVLRDVLLALQYLHSKGIVHRSVRASHILLSDKDGGSVRLSGMRYACSLLDSEQGLQDKYDYPQHVATNNLNWLSPEFLQQNLLGYNEKMDIYSLGVTACESANGLIPYSEMPGTLMLLEKLRGASPKLIDSTTLPLHAQHEQPASLSFTSDRPADSGVGASVSSCSNMATSKDTLYARRKFSQSFHDFVSDCSLLDARARPDAAQLLASPFIKQLKKMASAASASAASASSPLAALFEKARPIGGDFLSGEGAVGGACGGASASAGPAPPDEEADFRLAKELQEMEFAEERVEWDF